MNRCARAAVAAGAIAALAACGNPHSPAQAIPEMAPGYTNALPAGTPADDWITFAHDYSRSGLQSQRTGITKFNVSKLKLRWKKTVESAVYAAPLAWGGDVIVVTMGNPQTSTVYDFRTADGTLRWKKYIGGSVRATPSIDPAAGLLFVGNRITTNGSPQPSYLFALRLLDGSIAWRAPVDGPTHSSPVVANGSVYIGAAGGDPPACLNGGVEAFDEASGARRWTWRVNPQTKFAHGGGSVWGALAYDGGHIIFGTGNTCTTPVTTSNGAAALDANGKLVWSFVADQDSLDDDDTGGGVMISNGHASFQSKNGNLYTLAASSGTKLSSVPLGACAGRPDPCAAGGFATPTTNGSVVLIGAGNFITNSQLWKEFCTPGWGQRIKPNEIIPGRNSRVRALDANGNILWSKLTQNVLSGYVAIASGMAFLPIDKNYVALDLKTGKALWRYPIASYTDASAVVVPSGVYGADSAGNVYAFGISK